jgi:1-acyl-sn-glycerol-3-phosphate acyltransferase
MATVAAVYPWISLRWRRALKQRWSRQLLEMLGIRLKTGAGKAALPAGLVVCNHISWLDIFVINALAPAAFVSKAEVRDWPLIGWLCARTETIFLERGSRAAAQRTRERMIDHLQTGAHVAVFPEGTTTCGERVLPFHAALFQSAIDARRTVIPLALRYLDRRGDASRAPAYEGDTTLWQCLRAVACAGGLTAEVRVLAALDAARCERRELARHCHAAIEWHLGQHGGRPQAEAPTDEAPAVIEPDVVLAGQS